MTQPSMSPAEAEAAIAEKTAPKVTKDGIEEKIAAVDYLQPPGMTLTICILTMQNGFTVVGKSAAASPENFDKAIGERVAYDDAFRQVWALEGYLLREQLHEEAMRPPVRMRD